MNNAIRMSVFVIGMYVITVPAMAFDLGGIVKEAQKAAQQKETDANSQQPIKQAQPAKSTAQPDVAQPAKQDSDSQNAADTTAPNSAETTEPLELKGIKIGMTAQELLKLYPHATLSTMPPQNQNWIFADQFVNFGDTMPGSWNHVIDCQQVSANIKCTPVTIMGNKAKDMLMLFVNNKLVDGWIELPRINEGVYDTLLEGLSNKFKAKPTSKVIRKGGMADKVFRTAGWLNSSSKSHFTLIDDEFMEGHFVKIILRYDEYENMVEARRKTFSALAKKAEDNKNAKAKKDM